MVKSLLVDNVNYTESKSIEREDTNYEAPLFEGEVLGNVIVIAIGQGKYEFSEKGIVYYPIYVIKDELVQHKIGVYELLASDISNSIDDNGVLNPTLGNARLYSFVTKAMIEKLSLSSKDNKVSVSVSVSDNKTKYETLSEQSAEMAKKESLAYVEKKGDPWVKKYLKNDNYGIVDILGNGDCFFTTIEKGLRQVGKDVSVRNMRETLSNNATEELFDNYKELFQNASKVDTDLRSELRKLKKDYNALKKQRDSVSDRTENLAIVEQMNEIKKRNKIAKRESESAKEVLGEFVFMENVNSLDDFKAILLTNKYWADTWAISTLESELNVKVVIISKENFEADDIDNVIQCGQLNDNSIVKPTHYIITSYDGRHYELVTYKEKGALTFKELPYDIKKLVVDKCLEGQSGPYQNIDDFKDFFGRLNVTAPVDDVVDGVSPQFYDHETVFQFSARSADTKPGKGNGEKLGSEGIQSYTELSGIKNWRRKLTNESTQEFRLDGKRWQSVDIYMYAIKYKENNPSFYAEFSLDSADSTISQDPKKAKEASEKKKTPLRPDGVKVDPDFDDNRREQELGNALRAKFTQNEELMRILKATKRAKLQKYVNKSSPEVMTTLMRIRHELLKTTE